MKCLNREEIQFYIDGEMPEDKIQLVDLHLSGCEQCQNLYKEARAEVDLLHNAFGPYDELLEQRKIPAFSYPERKINIFWKLAAACVTVGIVFLASLYLSQSDQSGKSQETTIANNAPHTFPLNEFPVEDLDPNQQFLRGEMELDIILPSKLGVTINKN